MAAAGAATLGLVAGEGSLPFEIARGARRAGRRVAAAALRGFADPALADEVDALHWLYVGELSALLERLAAEGAVDVVLAGLVPKEHLFSGSGLVRVDARAAALLGELRARGDDAILRALGGALESAGLRLASQAEFAPHLLAPEGPLGATRPNAAQLEDVRFAWPLAKAIGRLDIGQTVVVRERTVLAVEAIEGTDAAIRRGGALGRGAACAVKVWKPDQDPRLDFPTIGPATVDALESSGVVLLAVEAGRTLVLERETLVRRADAAGICLLGVADPAGR
ncbi:MAG TPA: UDP-2,3-diacylglucosamine diphosphatase LpxI [Myxococcota bacterium]|nr:UDP-2,3-diacylglucosamine diphosphatase LpxI [Myxococcota bacterium]